MSPPSAGPRITKLGAAHTPLTRLVADALRERIFGGGLAPGQRLVEAQLSEELGVSRMPVREALRLLAAEGVVTIEPRRGATVTAHTPEQVAELIEVRATLEALNAKLAAKRIDPAQHRRLAQVLELGSRPSRHGDIAKLQEDNAAFHEALAQAAANSVLRDLIRMMRERTAVIFAPYSAKRASQNWKEHEAIVRAVIDGDAELAALLAARHVHSAAEALPPAMRGPLRREAAEGDERASAREPAAAPPRRRRA